MSVILNKLEKAEDLEKFLDDRQMLYFYFFFTEKYKTNLFCSKLKVLLSYFLRQIGPTNPN